MKKCIFPGSFDPLTIGHYDIVLRAAEIFDEVTVAVMINPRKNPMFSIDERVDMIKECFRDVENIKVVSSDGMLSDLAKSEGCNLILRGLRDSADFESEKQMSHVNSMLGMGLETVFLATKPEYQCISSAVVREILYFNGNITGFVPDKLNEIINKLRGKDNG